MTQHKLTIICLVVTLSSLCTCIEIARYDGFYNNVANPDWGVPGTRLYRKIPAAYSDGTYAYPKGPNERLISQQAMSGPSGLGSYMNRTSFLALFGQFVSLESVKGVGAGCPRELTPIAIPKCDPDYDPKCTGTKKTPFLRAKFDKNTGQSPGEPREQTNEVSSFIDGSVIYGNSLVQVAELRSFKDGKLRTLNDEGLMPPLNDNHMPVLNLPPAREHKLRRPERHWLTGDGRIFQHPALLAYYVVFMRYHNLMAEKYKLNNPSWDDEQIFQATRRWVIAVQQKIYAYDFYPAFTNDTLDKYTGYKEYVHPGTSHLYQSAAFRFGHTIVPPGFYRRDAKCNFYTTTEKTGEPEGYPAVRMCNTWFHGDEAFEYGLEPILLGMASQITEREDHILNEDVRGKVFGPLQHSKRDLTAINIKRGRDNGFPDYNTARKALGLKVKTNFSDINPWLYAQQPEVFDRLRDVYDGDINKVDIFAGGLFESTEEGPGELFRLIIRDQFTRFRDGDRFWFENRINEFFTDEEIASISNTTLYSMILETTNIKQGEIQENVFFWLQGDPCEQPKQLNGSDMSECNANQGYDFFSGSEGGYIAIGILLCAFPIGCLFLPALIQKLLYGCRRGFLTSGNLTSKLTPESQEKVHDLHETEAWEYYCKGRWRRVDATFSGENSAVIVFDKNQGILRNMRFNDVETIDIKRANDSKIDVICINTGVGHDLILSFRRPTDTKFLLDCLERFSKENNIAFRKTSLPEAKILSDATCLSTVIKQAEVYMRHVFAELFSIDVQCDLPPDVFKKDILQLELTRHEFAEATRLKAESEFVQLMFDTLDNEQHGCLKLRRIIAFIVLICDVSSKKKLKALFDMYDATDTGVIQKKEFLKVIRIIEDMANSENDDSLLEAMMAVANLDEKQELSFDDLLHLTEQDDSLKENLGKAFERLDRVNTPDTQRSTITRPMTVPKFMMRPTSARPSSSVTRDGFEKATMPATVQKTGIDKWWNTAQKFMTNYRQRILVLLLFFFITTAVFIERFQIYVTEKEHSGIRRITGYGVPVTRGAASSMSFTYSIVMLSMCKNTVNALRSTRLALYLPLDSAFAFHKITAITSVALTALHVLGHMFNFYHVSTQPPDFVECIFKNMVWFRSDHLPTFSFWMFQTVTGLSGMLLVVTLSILVAFSTSWVRLKMYNVFYLVHKLFYILYVLIIIHGSAVLVQQPWFHFFFLGPAVLYTCDKLYGMRRKLAPLKIIYAEHMPSGVLHIKVKKPAYFDFSPGQYAQVACQEISSRQFHPFTITSSPDEKFLSFHIRALGPWTSTLSELMSPERHLIPVMFVDGPYGGVSGAFHKYPVSVMAAGGIGVTAFSAILRQLLYDRALKAKRCKKIYFIWSTGRQAHWEWFVDVLREIEEVDIEGFIDVHMFITNHYEKFDLRTLLMFLSEKHLISVTDANLLTGLQSSTHFGRPDYPAILDAVAQQHSGVQNIGVFASGPSIMTRAVGKACALRNRHSEASFEFYEETFSG